MVDNGIAKVIVEMVDNGMAEVNDEFSKGVEHDHQIAYRSTQTVDNMISTSNEPDRGDSDKSPQFPTHPPDGGFGWIVVASSFMIHVFVLGSLYTFGVYYPVYIDHFQAGQGEVAWVGSIGAALMVGGGLWTGSYADRFGNNLVTGIGAAFVGAGFLLGSFATKLWHLYLTQGVLAGIGYSLSYIAGVSVVGQWFRERRGLAIGIAVAGSGLGQFALSQITHILIEKYGWRGCLRITALINFGGLLLSSLVLRRFLPLVRTASTMNSLSSFRDYNFKILYISSTFFALGFFMPFTHLPLYAELHGVSTADAIFILSISGIASAAGRIILGFVADVVGKVNMLRICMAGGGITVLCWMACDTFAQLMVIGVLYGMFAGGIISLIPTVCAELFGIANIGSVLGLLYTSNAVGNLLSAPIGGFLFDASHNYFPPIAVAGGFLIIAAVLSLFVDEKLAQHLHHPHLHPTLSIDQKEVELSVADQAFIEQEIKEEQEERNFVEDFYVV